ncbi:hypothetical protein [Kribbella deserti]|uniref:Uncharacterized protein n=1 Tax=Kribbella deserti TaxID=1926257 RepID=A0ABV6QLS8_9ACTN
MHKFTRAALVLGTSVLAVCTATLPAGARVADEPSSAMPPAPMKAEAKAPVATTAVAPQGTAMPAAAGDPATLVRYYNRGTARHRVTTVGLKTAGWYAELGGLWGLLRTNPTNTRALYECRAGSYDYFISFASNCGGKVKIGLLGYIYKTKPKTPATAALWQCYQTKGDHFVSIRSNCEGARNAGFLGYARTTASLVGFSRYNNGPDHWETSSAVDANYRREGSWAIRWTQTSRSRALYGCSYPIGTRTDHFLSLQANCEGKRVLRREGFVYTFNPGSKYTAIYRCLLPSGDHFTSARSNCEAAAGVKNEGRLGWVRLTAW